MKMTWLRFLFDVWAWYRFYHESGLSRLDSLVGAIAAGRRDYQTANMQTWDEIFEDWDID